MKLLLLLPALAGLALAGKPVPHSSLPGWTATNNMWAGYAAVNPDCNSNIFYWIVEKAGGSTEGETPVVLWLNGGPGASSITGLLVENIGPMTINAKGDLIENKSPWTDDFNVLIIDNPVGAGYSYTDNRTECYASSEAEVASQFHLALAWIMKQHPEFSSNPFWLTGESYAGKYIPNIAQFLLDKPPFDTTMKGVILGNGLYEPAIQYPTVPGFAYGLGIIDDQVFAQAQRNMTTCVNMIKQGPSKAADAAKYCEAIVGNIYDNQKNGVCTAPAGCPFRYDLLQYDTDLDSVTDAMGKFLNNPKTMRALGTVGHTWVQADEVGPVADALRADFVNSVNPVLEALLEANKQVTLYNGQFDGSVCNHVGNILAMKNMTWTGQKEWMAQRQFPWRTDEGLFVGYYRAIEQLQFILVTGAGHLVGMNTPETFKEIMDQVINRKAPWYKR